MLGEDFPAQVENYQQESVKGFFLYNFLLESHLFEQKTLSLLVTKSHNAPDAARLMSSSVQCVLSSPGPGSRSSGDQSRARGGAGHIGL